MRRSMLQRDCPRLEQKWRFKGSVSALALNMLVPAVTVGLDHIGVLLLLSATGADSPAAGVGGGDTDDPTTLPPRLLAHKGRHVVFKKPQPAPKPQLSTAALL